jgi:hypothetical protein
MCHYLIPAVNSLVYSETTNDAHTLFSKGQSESADLILEPRVIPEQIFLLNMCTPKIFEIKIS